MSAGTNVSFLVQFSASPRGVKVCLLLFASPYFSYNAITSCAGKVAVLGLDHDRFIEHTPHPSPAQWHPTFPHPAICHSLTGFGLFPLPITQPVSWTSSDCLHGYLKGTFISSDHYHKPSIRPLCQMGNQSSACFANINFLSFLLFQERKRFVRSNHMI